MTVIVAVDIGGTFTDLVAYDTADRALAFAKSPTTPTDLSRGILHTLARAGVDPAACQYFKHGTTVVINALLERKGARTAFVTTEGFRDVPELGRGNRPELFNLFYRRDAPIAPRPLRHEVTERMDAAGVPVTPLDLDGLATLADLLVADGVEAIAVCFLNAYRNPAHEQAAGELLRARTGCFVSLSHELSREWREYERSSTTLANAYVGPLVARYVERLESALGKLGFAGRLLLMESNGGVMSAETGRTKPILLTESGPVAGCVGALELGALLGERNVVAFDMGGTTAKCALVQDGRLSLESTYYIGGYERGLPVQAPVVDILEVGAGGGSIAWVDEYGGLQVGPRSAGAEPGPVCFGKGGAEPTIVDAHLVLGHLAADRFLGGEMPLDRPAALAALAERVARPLQADPYHIAAGVLQIANVLMAGAIRKMTLERGLDPREFTLIAYGGTGPLHATYLARELSIPRVVVPPMPAHFSALGMLLADLRHDFASTLVSPLDLLPAARLRDAFATLEEEARAEVRRSMPEAGEVRLSRVVELRYHGQHHTLRLPVDGLLDGDDLAPVRAAFDRAYEQRYGRNEPDSQVELTGLRLTAEGVIPKPDLRLIGPDSAPRPAAEPTRDVYDTATRTFRPWRVVQREALAPGAIVEGPAVIHEYASTTLLWPGDRAVVGAFGVLDVTVGGPG
jgi:N-methylhydantoinase A